MNFHLKLVVAAACLLCLMSVALGQVSSSIDTKEDMQAESLFLKPFFYGGYGGYGYGYGRPYYGYGNGRPYYGYGNGRPYYANGGGFYGR